MKKLLGVFLLVAAFLQADCSDPYAHKRNAFLMPIGRVIVTPSFGDHYATSLLLEGGLRDARANLTLGTQMEMGRLKVSGEYLTQRLTYDFASGKTHQWVQQGAVGAHYQHLLDCQALKALDLKGYYSYAPSKNLSNRTCDDYIIERRIAGSNAWGVSFGGVATPFCEDLLNVTVAYDHVKYRRQFKSDKTVQGFGGTIDYTFRLQCCLDVNLKAEFRRPYNYYGLKFAWHRDPNWTVGLFAGYTAGKYHLPRSTSAGIEFAYLFDSCGCVQRDACPPLWTACDIQSWVQAPAVMMPEVLAIVDQRSSRPCPESDIPTSNEIPEQTIIAFEDSLDLTSFFSGPNLTFTAVGLPEGVSLLDNTSAILVTGEELAQLGDFTVQLIATNACGSTSQVFTLSVRTVN